MQFRIYTLSAAFVASSVLLAVPYLVEAFAPSSFPQQKQSLSTRLFYTMPDVTSMKAAEIRQELESYGINTQTLFDKREFEEALIEARRHYESTINDVMSSNRPKKKKVQTRRRTVQYERAHHKDERIYSTDVNVGPNKQHYRQQRRQEARPHRRQYQATPDPMGGGFHTYPNQDNGRGRSRPGNEWFEEDPLFAHEAQHHPQDNHHHHYHSDPQQHYDEYEVGPRRRQQKKQREQPQYDDPAIQMKYQTALQESYNMKVEDLQYELNCRGISTKYCMIFKDFCIEYAKAIAENRQKVVSEDDEEDDETSSIFGDDNDDYDPSYRDVVMQKYDPSMWI
mmetsp:Transcript_8951/g.21832  ORF Transcript_8951/g.21832 Transcript_8951/m.21832 type:complete len:338 (-) Transcript_8951:452-1465(-)